MHKTRLLSFALACAVLVAAGATGAFLSNVDYSAMPAPAAEVHKQIASHNVKLAKAIEIAEHEVNGMAKSAVMRHAQTPPVIEVEVYSADKAHRIIVNADSGNIVSSTVTDGPWSSTASGVKYFDIQVGDGAQAEATSTVTLHYTGWLIDGKKFDSSVDRGQPATFPLGGLIAGWKEGVPGMKVGGKRKLIIPYQLAYGEMGRPPVIPAKATLIFEIELLNVAAGPSQPAHDHSGHDHSGHDH